MYKIYKHMVTKKVSATKTVSKTAKKGFDRFFSGKSLIILVFSTLLLLIVPLIWYMNKRIFIARVNGQPISRIEFYKELQKSSGETVLNDLITKKLISQEADKRGIKISEADVQNELGKIRSSIESQGSTLEDVLTYQGVTKAQLVENIQIQKKLEGILKEQITVSDSDVKDYYDQNKTAYPATQTFDQLKDQIRSELYQSKIQEAYASWIAEVRGKSLIEKYL